MTDHTDELTAMAQEDGMYDKQPEIKPRMVDGVGYCDVGCPRAKDCKWPPGSDLPVECQIDKRVRFVQDRPVDICPIWAQRTVRWAEVLINAANDKHNPNLRNSIAFYVGDDFLSLYPGAKGGE